MFRCDIHKEYNPTCGPPSKSWDYDFKNVSLDSFGTGTCEGCPNCWRSYASCLFRDLRKACEVQWDLRQDVADLMVEKEELKESRRRVLTSKSHLATQYLELLGKFGEAE